MPCRLDSTSETAEWCSWDLFLQCELTTSTSSSIGLMFVVDQSSLFVIQLVQNILRTFQRHILMKVCSLDGSLSVINHVALPYSRTDFTFELNIFSLVLLRIRGLRVVNANCAFLFLASTSSSAPPDLDTTLPGMWMCYHHLLLRPQLWVEYPHCDLPECLRLPNVEL